MPLRECKCPIEPNMTFEELYTKVLPYNCCGGQEGPGYMCPTLNREFIRARKDRDTRERYKKTKKRQGYTDEQLKDVGKRRSGPASYKGVDLF